MPLPDNIRALIGPKFNPSRQRADYKTFIDDWKLYRDLTELDRGRLKSLLQKHGENENEDKWKIRQGLASAFNLIPMILSMTRGYLYSEEPSIDVKDDACERFLADCDGSGTSWVNFVRQSALPLSMAYGWLDILVQNPFIPDGFVTAADQRDSRLTPTVFPITPIQRLNWSARSNHEYNWMTFADIPAEPVSAFDSDAKATASYVTVSAAQLGPNGEQIPGFWVRHVGAEGKWVFDGDLIPTARAPIATLYYQRSNDPDRRHFGVSKIAMMAVLTLNTIQLLSWIYEDILANLSLLAIPTRDGKLPKKEGSDDATPFADIGAFSVVSYPRDAKGIPQYIQGATAHIKIKMTQVEMNLREIQRLALLIGASGSVQQASSGVQAVVQRTELFQELGDQAGALDVLTLDTLALVKSWETGEDWSRDRLTKEIQPRVSFYKGPFVVDPLPQLILNVNDIARVMGEVTPTLIKVMQKQLAAQCVYADDPSRKIVMEEIEAHSANITPTLGAPAADPTTGEPKQVATNDGPTGIETSDTTE
jgi:hypothetical protein